MADDFERIQRDREALEARKARLMSQMYGPKAAAAAEPPPPLQLANQDPIATIRELYEWLKALALGRTYEQANGQFNTGTARSNVDRLIKELKDGKRAFVARAASAGVPWNKAEAIYDHAAIGVADEAKEVLASFGSAYAASQRTERQQPDVWGTPRSQIVVKTNETFYRSLCFAMVTTLEERFAPIMASFEALVESLPPEFPRAA